MTMTTLSGSDRRTHRETDRQTHTVTCTNTHTLTHMHTYSTYKYTHIKTEGAVKRPPKPKLGIHTHIPHPFISHFILIPFSHCCISYIKSQKNARIPFSQLKQNCQWNNGNESVSVIKTVLKNWKTPFRCDFNGTSPLTRIYMCERHVRCTDNFIFYCFEITCYFHYEIF